MLVCCALVSLTGIYFLFVAAVANLNVDSMIIQLSRAHAAHVEMPSLGHLVTGLLAGGHLLIIPTWTVYLVGGTGAVLLWLGYTVGFIIYRKQKVKDVLNLNYIITWRKSFFPVDPATPPSPPSFKQRQNK